MARKIQQYKKDAVKNVLDLAKEYPIIGILNLEGLPAQQLQAMRSDMRKTHAIVMTKKTFMAKAFDQLEKDHPGIKKLEEYFFGMPALLFTKESPFILSKNLAKNKTPAPARAGQVAPRDIIIPAGKTPFAPGPVISELSGIGLDVGVDGGKVAVKADGVVAEKGSKIEPKVAEMLTRLDIKPMEVGLDLVAAYEEGVIYDKDVLEVDDEQFMADLEQAGSAGFNLAFNLGWVTKENVELLITKAHNDAKGVGVECNIIDDGVVEDLLAKGERGMLSLKDTASIEVGPAKEAPAEEKKEESKAEEKPAEASKEEKKEEAPKEEPKPEPTPEPAKEEPKQEAAPEEKKEEAPAEPEAPKEEPAQEQSQPEEKEAPKVEEKPAEPEQAPKEEVQEEPKAEEKAPEPAAEEKKEAPEPAKEEAKPADDGPQEVTQINQTAPAAEKAPEQKEAPAEEKKAEEKPSPSPEPSKDDSSDKKTEADMAEVEDLTKELIKKGTLRK